MPRRRKKTNAEEVKKFESNGNHLKTEKRGTECCRKESNEVQQAEENSGTTSKGKGGQSRNRSIVVGNGKCGSSPENALLKSAEGKIVASVKLSCTDRRVSLTSSDASTSRYGQNKYYSKTATATTSPPSSSGKYGSSPSVSTATAQTSQYVAAPTYKYTSGKLLASSASNGNGRYSVTAVPVNATASNNGTTAGQPSRYASHSKYHMANRATTFSSSFSSVARRSSNSAAAAAAAAAVAATLNDTSSSLSVMNASQPSRYIPNNKYHKYRRHYDYHRYYNSQESGVTAGDKKENSGKTKIEPKCQIKRRETSLIVLDKQPSKEMTYELASAPSEPHCILAPTENKDNYAVEDSEPSYSWTPFAFTNLESVVQKIVTKSRRDHNPNNSVNNNNNNNNNSNNSNNNNNNNNSNNNNNNNNNATYNSIDWSMTGSLFTNSLPFPLTAHR